MKPLYLSFKGLNSFSERAEIDFTKLTSSGIFGIFGDTGSGKSTILDGINFALYGDVGRSKEKTDIINYKCDSVEVRFEFNVLSDGERKNYIVDRSIKRKSGVHKASLYEECSGESLCIADNASTVKQKIIEIIGVSADDFRKCIALPQGEFAEFVQSEPRERIKLIERLFNLSRYGERLKDKLRDLAASNENEYQKLCGELSAYDDVDDGKVKQITDQLKLKKADYSALENTRAEKEKVLNFARSLNADKIKLDEAEANLAALNKLSEEMEKLAKNLKRLPDCRRVCDEENYAADAEKKIKSERERLDNLDLQIKEAEKTASAAAEKLTAFGYEGKLAEISERSAILSASKDKFQTLDDRHDKLNDAQREYETLKKERNTCKETLDKYLAKLEDIKAEAEKIPTMKIEDVLSDEVRAAFVRGAYVNEFNFICELRENIKEYRSDTKLYKFVTAELTTRINYLEELVRGSIPSKISVSDKIKQFEDNSRLREQYTARISKGEKAVADCKTALGVAEEKLTNKTAECKEKSESFQKLLSELSSFGNQPDYDRISRQIKQDKDTLDGEYNKLKIKLEKANSAYSSLVEEKKNGLKYLSHSEEENNERRRKINNMLSQFGFDSVENCTALLNEFGDYTEAQKKLDNYRRSIATNSEIVEKLKNIEGIRQMSQSVVNAAEEEIKACDAALLALNAEIKVSEHALEQLTEKLTKKKELLQQSKSVTEKRNLIGQLKVLLKDNNFMKFVADGHLGEISKSASKTLLELTNGRYFLVYKDGFFVGDNFNGGTERGVNTLSGGETFLVSLSLALSLSAVICARSNKNIEFFFLDEGFGTLDETLIDTVMDALEKLKNSHFTIGIISHVEELKHRIESKIIVNKATESHGSTLTLSC